MTTQAPAQAPVKDTLNTSASAIENFRLCNRMWWLDKVLHLPQPTRGSHVFGTVLASVLERYLKADDLGYDEHGQPVNIYPEGWKQAHNKFTGEPDGEVTPAEADIIQRLVAKSLEEGIIERRPQRSVENEFRFPIVELPCETCQGSGWVMDVANVVMQCPFCQNGKGTTVWISGAADLLYPEEVQDHKSTKRMKYAKSANALRKNPQLLIYCKVILERCRAQGRPLPEKVTVRHNVFCKDPDDLRVKKVEATVTREEIEAHWDRVIQDVRLMDHYRRHARIWHDLPDPPTGISACNAYGGCSYISICSGRESQEGYAHRLDTHLRTRNNDRVQLTISGKPGENDMNKFAANLAASSGQPLPPQQQQGYSPQINPPMPQGPAPQPPQPPQQYAQPPQPPQGYQPQPPPPQQLPYVPPSQGQQYVPPPQGPQQYAQPPHQGYQPQPPAQQPPQQFALQSQSQPYTIPQQPQQPPQQPSQVTVTAPPWANQSCVACSGFGFNTKGEPCGPCVAHAGQNQKPGPDKFSLQYPGNGSVTWQHVQIPNYHGISPLPANGPVQASESVKTPKAQPSQQPTYAPQTAPTAQAQAPDEDGEGAKPLGNGRGRPAKGFILLINAEPSRGATTKGERRCVDLRQVLNDISGEIAKTYNVASFYDLHPDQRRDLIAKSAEAVADSISTGMAYVMGMGPEPSDIKALCDSLVPLAGMVWNAWTPVYGKN